MTEAAFAIPGDLDSPTGGYAYDRQILRRLADHGVAARHVRLPDSFPFPSPVDLAETLRLLPQNGVALIDGLAFGAMPLDVIASVQAPIVALVHHPLALETGLPSEKASLLHKTEATALTRAASVIVTSRATAGLLIADFGVPADRIHVALPGTEPAPRSAGDGHPVRLLAVGSVVPRKGYELLIGALAGLAHLPWSLTIVGTGDRASDYALTIRRLIAEHALEDRVFLAGATSETRLDQFYAEADAFVMTSHFEGFGMVLTEALARGLPIVTTRVGAASETINDDAAFKVDIGDAAALGHALHRVIADPRERARLADAAWAQAQTMVRWDETARIIAGILKDVSR